LKLNTPILEMQDVSKTFTSPSGTIRVLQRINLSVKSSEFVIITGPSGSGKTTFLHLSALLDSPTTGRMFFDGLDSSALKESDLCRLRKRKIGMVFQKHCLLSHRSVFENVQFRFRYIDMGRDEIQMQVEKALETVNLLKIAQRPVRLLSGGEMQRVAIARAIALEPKLLIADEPTGNLDREASTLVMAHLKELNRLGITVLMVTHNESLIDSFMRPLSCQDGTIAG